MAREGWTLEVFDSHEAAASADRDRYRAMTPDERVQAMLELVDAWTGASQQGLDRTYRFVEVPQR